MIKKMIKSTKGFTLTELIVVVVILGVLAAISVPLITGYIGDSKVNADNSNAKIIEGVVKRNIAKGELTLNDTTDLVPADVLTKVTKELGELPKAKQGDTFKFQVNVENGNVKVTNAEEADPWLEIK